MRSKSVYTTLIDDVDVAAWQLAEQLEDGFEVEKNAVGLLFTYSDMDVAGLAEAVQAALSFPVIGCTCIASMDNGGGDVNVTLAGGMAAEDRLVLLGITGVKPVFSVQNVTGVDVERKRKVTSEKDNTAYTVNGGPFTDYLRTMGLPVETLTQGKQQVRNFAHNESMVLCAF